MNKGYELGYDLLLIFSRFDHSSNSTFPDNQTSDPNRHKLPLNHFVPSDIRIKFILPEVNSALRSICIPASFMAMPVTAVYEYSNMKPSKIYIRTSGKLVHILPVAQSLCKQQLPQIYFWLCIFAPNCLHIAAPLFGRLDVCHGIKPRQILS